jgi:hypothetical protein
VVWVSGRRDHHLFVLGGGLVRTFSTKSRRTTSGVDKRAPRLSRYIDLQVPLLPDDLLSPLVRNIIDPDEYLDFDRDLDAGNNTMVLNQPRIRLQAHDHGAESSIPQAEIESSAPYQPFHTDRRVALFELSLSQQEMDLTAIMAAASLGESRPEPTPRRKKVSRQTPHTPVTPPTPPSKPSCGPCVFGQPIQSTKLDLGMPQLLDDDASFSSHHIPLDASRALPAAAMERILQRTAGDDDAQIVVTTRRRRGAVPALPDEDGFFEDDCEVLDFADQRV